MIENARRNGFIFIQKLKLTTKNYSNLSQINIHYYVKLQLTIMHRHFFQKNYPKIEIMYKHIVII